MSSLISFPLQVTPLQAASLATLQAAFADACNFLAPIVREHQCWNRVALHHLAYRQMREHFPDLGAQMACNAIYSVCRFARLVYQHPKSPWHVQRLAWRPLPRLRFSKEAPVFFDRHTLSMRDGRLSLFTLDGRLHFSLDLSEQLQQRFCSDKLKEIVLVREAEGFALRFLFGDRVPSEGAVCADEWPEFLIIEAPESQMRPAAFSLIEAA